MAIDAVNSKLAFWGGKNGMEVRAVVGTYVQGSETSFEEWMEFTACKLINGIELRYFSELLLFLSRNI